jgi:hypothetical protein
MHMSPLLSIHYKASKWIRRINSSLNKTISVTKND